MTACRLMWMRTQTKETIVLENEMVFAKVQKNIDDLANQNVGWAKPVTHEQIQAYIAQGKPPETVFMPPREWLFEEMKGKEVLCLAGAGGQQAPLLAALGANVTVFDLSANMLAKDKLAAQRERLAIQIVQGNMCDLSRFSDEAFDMIVNPPSLMYVPDVLPVFRECYRVLKKQGVLIVCAPNPINFICEFDEKTQNYIACNTLPYKSYEHDDQGAWIEYGHTLESYIGGQISAGFSLTGFYERKNGEVEADFVTRTVKTAV